MPVSSAPKWADGIDPARQPGDHDEPAFAERRRQESRASRRPFAEALRAPTTATIGRAQQLGQPEHGQDRRRVLDGGERIRIIGLAPADEPGADAAQRGHLGLGRRPRHGGDGRAALAAAGEPRQHVEGGARPSRNGAASRKN